MKEEGRFATRLESGPSPRPSPWEGEGGRVEGAPLCGGFELAPLPGPLLEEEGEGNIRERRFAVGFFLTPHPIRFADRPLPQGERLHTRAGRPCHLGLDPGIRGTSSQA